MKKIFFLFLLFTAVVTVYSQTAEHNFGVILEMTGDVEIRPAGSLSFYHAWTGCEIELDTIISTGFRSSAVISVGSSVITVRPLTRLSLSEIQSSVGAESVNVNLETGRIRVDVKPPAGVKANTTVKSPNATASVRGTTLEMDILNISVIDGHTVFSGNSGVSLVVSGGSSSTIAADGSALNPADIATAALMPPKVIGVSASGKPAGTVEIEKTDN